MPDSNLLQISTRYMSEQLLVTSFRLCISAPFTPSNRKLKLGSICVYRMHFKGAGGGS